MNQLESSPTPVYDAASVLPDDYEQEEEILRQAADILERRMKRQTFSVTSPQALGRLVSALIGGDEVESFGVCFMDTQNQVIATEVLFTGGTSSCDVDPLHIIRRVVFRRATAVALFHNHPSGYVTPSESDFAMTTNIIKALKCVNVRVLDHLVVGGNAVESLRRHRAHMFGD